MGSLGTEALLGMIPETAIPVLLRRGILFLERVSLFGENLSAKTLRL